MAEATSKQPQINLPSRNIIITGEHSARMVNNAVRVSRIEQRAIQMVMAPAKVRDLGRNAMDRITQAMNRFEDELASIEKDMESTERPSNRRRKPKNNSSQPAERTKLNVNNGKVETAAGQNKSQKSSTSSAPAEIDVNPSTQTKPMKDKNEQKTADKATSVSAAITQLQAL